MFHLHSLYLIIGAVCLLEQSEPSLAELVPCNERESVPIATQFHNDLLKHGLATVCFAGNPMITVSAARVGHRRLAICGPSTTDWHSEFKQLVTPDYSRISVMADADLTRTSLDASGNAKTLQCHIDQTSGTFKQGPSKNCFTPKGLSYINAEQFHKKLLKTGVHFCVSAMGDHQRALDVVAVNATQLAVCYENEVKKEDVWFIDNVLPKLPQGISYNRQFSKPGEQVTVTWPVQRKFECKSAGAQFLRFEAITH